jgi:hypothetical protein
MVLDLLESLDARERLTRAAMFVAALIQCAPIVGVVGRASLQKLYGITIHDDATELLLRHRAVLLALVGALIAAGAAQPAHRTLGLTLGLASKLAFLALWVRTAGPSSLTRIALADVASALLLVLAALSRGR